MVNGRTGGGLVQCTGAWCVTFNHTGILNRLRRRTIRSAYRPAALFLSTMHQAGYSTAVVGCDDTLDCGRVDGTIARDDDAGTMFYLATHGRFDAASGYDAILHSTVWSPGTTGLGLSNLVVAILDTCETIDGRVHWQGRWEQSRLGSSLRIILGFDGKAPCDQGSGTRGAAFASELLAGKTIADAWLVGTKSSLVPGTGTPVAIGLGDTPMDAQQVLGTARLHAMPPPRSGSRTVACAKY
jgi:hypothetical protein